VSRRRGLADRGQVAGIEVVPFGLLVLVVVALVLANAWAVVDARLAVGAAAREAGRAAVESDDPTAARSAARRAVDDVLAGHGRDLHRAAVVVHVGDGWGRCARVTATVSGTVPAVSVPFVGGIGNRRVRASHTELVDPFRAGLPGEARCDA
jgi:Flp pilus assembly protein TadG